MKTLLFNPFERYLEKDLLLAGTILTLIGSGFAYFLHGRFDGVLDLHFVLEIVWWQPFVDNLINILSLSILLFIAAKIINSRTRFVDILIASVVAKIPYYFLLLFNINGFISEISSRMVHPETLQVLDLSFRTMVPILIFTFFSILIAIWFITLLYNGYKVASHAKGTKAVVLFIAAIVIAEVISKILISQFN